jgi:hypothetical protein
MQRCGLFRRDLTAQGVSQLSIHRRNSFGEKISTGMIGRFAKLRQAISKEGKEERRDTETPLCRWIRAVSIVSAIVGRRIAAEAAYFIKRNSPGGDDYRRESTRAIMRPGITTFAANFGAAGRRAVAKRSANWTSRAP